MMALDSQALGDEDEEDDDLPPAAKAERMGVGRLRFAALLRTIQQDAQTRLVFRAQAVIQSEVLHFVPSPEDLKYPEKVEEVGEKGLMLWTEDERMRDLETERERERERERGRDARSAKEGGGFRVPREEVQGSWYPTLKRTVWVLSRLNTYVNVSTPTLSGRRSLTALTLVAIVHDFSLARTPSSKTLRVKPSRCADNPFPPRRR